MLVAYTHPLLLSHQHLEDKLLVLPFVCSIAKYLHHNGLTYKFSTVHGALNVSDRMGFKGNVSKSLCRPDDSPNTYKIVEVLTFCFIPVNAAPGETGRCRRAVFCVALLRSDRPYYTSRCCNLFHKL